MDTKLMENIIAIADYGNITRAAEALFITQSGLNQQLIRLEAELGTPLFARTKRYLYPTQAGKIYIDTAREILQLKRSAYTQIQDLADSTIGDIRFGLSFEHGVDLFINISPAFNKAYPGVKVHLQELKVSESHSKLASGQLDLAFVMLREQDKQDFHYIRLCEERLVLGVPAAHPLARLASEPGNPLTSINLSALKGERFALMYPGSTMRNVIDPLFIQAGFQPEILVETTMNQALARLASNGLCCTILPQSYARDIRHAAWFQLTDDPRWDWYLVYPKNIILSEAARYLIRLAQDYARQMELHWQNCWLGMPNIEL